MAAIEDVYSSRVLFDADGEALDFTDMNDMQLRWQDQLLGNLLGSSLCDPGDPTDPTGAIEDPEGGGYWNQLANASFQDNIVLAPFPSCAYVRPNGVANQLEIMPGPLYLPNGSGSIFDNTGEGAALIRLPDGTTLTTAVGDATNPRIDIIEIGPTTGSDFFADGDPEARHFEDATTRAPSTQNPDKRRRAEWTIQVKQGTPAATPTYPTPTAGFRVLTSLWVAATFNAAWDSSDVVNRRIRDHRFPMGKVIAYDVQGENAMVLSSGGNPWTKPGDGPVNAAAASGAADPIRFVCPVGSKSARLVGIGIHGRLGTTGTCNLVTEAIDTTIADTQILADLQVALWPVAPGFRFANATQLMDLANASTSLPFSNGEAIVQGARLANTLIGCPLWASGDPAGLAYAGVAGGAISTQIRRLAVKFTGDVASTVWFVRFYIAHGL